MPVTDADRLLASESAHRIANKPGHQAHLLYHFSENISYEESLRRGILTECAWVHQFGGKVDTELRDYGDAGKDFYVVLDGKQHPVNIKTKSVRVSFAGMVRVGTHLRVPVRECRPETIYVFGVYYEQTDDADVLRWEWGGVLIELNDVRNFDVDAQGHRAAKPIPAYVKVYDDLRQLRELKILLGLIKPPAERQVLLSPDLQELVEKYGGYINITPAAWEQYDDSMSRWHVQRRWI